MAIIIRAHNEEDTIVQVITALKEAGETVWVAASGCTDETVVRAEAAGAKTLITPFGLGTSTCAALNHFASQPVVFVDGDLSSPRVDTVLLLRSAAELGFVGKGAMDRAGRSSYWLPHFAAEAGVDLPEIPPQALTSAYSSYPKGFADAVDLSLVPENRGSDLMLSLLAHQAGIGTVVIPAGPRAHRNRGEAHVESLIAENRAALQIFKDAFPSPES